MMIKIKTTVALVALVCSQVVNSFAPPVVRSCTRQGLLSKKGSRTDGIVRSVRDGRLDGGARFPQSESNRPGFFSSAKRSKRVQHKDVVVIGGGLAGLSAALYLCQMDPDRQVTIVEREDPSQLETTAGSFAAAGMLAPQSERLPRGPLLDLCLASRSMYRDFVDIVESLASESGEEGEKYLTYGDGTVGMVASGGFLAPAFAGDSVATWAPPEESGEAMWLDSSQVRELEPHLHPDVVGGWWFPDDASVDARRLTCSLRAACAAAGVQILCGPNFEVTSLDLNGGECHGLWLQNGRYLKTKSILVANGSWMRSLLPVPVEPHKGQSMSLRMPTDRPPLLRRVLFAQDSYIVPKEDGRIVVGATVEAGSYDPNVTPAGLMHIMKHAIQLVPELANLPLEETWAGLRPTTPDKGPILGKTPWKNLFLAGGYWRNGVLLAPKTGQLLANLISGQPMSDSDASLLEAFQWDRFISPGGGKLMAANARYAASMHPVHSRSQGAGVSAAVGTELGTYSTARAAQEERERDRVALSSELDSFEQAALLGQQEGEMYFWDDDKDDDAMTTTKDEETADAFEPPFPEANGEVSPASSAVSLSTFEGTADAYTVPSEEDTDLSTLYENIRENQSLRSLEMDDAVKKEESEDPGFRIYRVDEETGEEYLVPPFTKPEEMDALIAEGKAKSNTNTVSSSEEAPTLRAGAQVNSLENDKLSQLYEQIGSNKANNVEMAAEAEEDFVDPGFRIWYVDEESGAEYEVPPYTKPEDMAKIVAKIKKGEQDKGAVSDSQPPDEKQEDEGYNGDMYDGYSAIQEANSRPSRQGELDAMRDARRKNRMADGLDVSKIGVWRPEDIVS